MTSMSRRILVALPLMAVGLASAARAQGNPPANASASLFQNVRIFDGKSGSLSAPSSVLVKGNIIETHLDDAYRCRTGCGRDRRQWANADARPDRRTLACDVDTARS